ncbi:MAG: hypothetical protein ACWA5P_07520 [bacterium]
MIHIFKKVISYSALFAFLFCSCNENTKEYNYLQIAQNYYQALNQSDAGLMNAIIADSLLTVEEDYDYEQTFTKKEYINNWLKWDGIFEPTYKVLQLEADSETIKAEVSKSDKRILVLHENPTVWKATIRFTEGKISSIHRTNVVFNDSIWVANRSKLINWVDENHPELNGFLDNQNESVAEKYLKALELYQKASKN